MLSLRDVAFAEWPARALLGLEGARLGVDVDFARFGWARPPEVLLTTSRYEERLVVRPLLIALHGSDEPAGGIEIEFEIQEAGEDVVVIAPLERVMSDLVKPLLGDEAELVLALCNPRAVAISRPDWLEDRRLCVAMGDVTSWLDHSTDGGERIRLTSRQWRVLDAEEPDDR